MFSNRLFSQANERRSYYPGRQLSGGHSMASIDRIWPVVARGDFTAAIDPFRRMVTGSFMASDPRSLQAQG
jgi:hypothetical protein